MTQCNFCHGRYTCPKHRDKVRIDIGGGLTPEYGFESVDISVGIDVEKFGLPYYNDSVDEIWTSHFLEHILDASIPFVFGEMARVIKPGGVITINVPNLEQACKDFIAASEEEKWGFPLVKLFGLQHGDGQVHKTGYTAARLTKILESVGLSVVNYDDHYNSHGQTCILMYATK